MPKKLPTGLIRRTGRERYYAVFNDGTGRRRQKAHSRDRGVSEQMLRELQRQLDLKSVGLGDLVAQETTLADVEKSYLCDLKTRVTPAHHGNVLAALKEILNMLPVRRVAGLDTDHVLEVRRKLVEGGQDHRTANKKIGHLQSMMRWAEKTRLIGRSPLGQIQKLPETGSHFRRCRRRLTRDELASLIEAAHQLDELRGGVPQAILIELMAGTGFRVSEAFSLCWRDLGKSPDGTHTLTVRAAFAKTRRERTTPIHEQLHSSLLRHRSNLGHATRRIPAEKDRILWTRQGIPWSDSYQGNALPWFDGVRRTSGIPEVGADGSTLDFYGLRHTYCTLLAEAGVSLEIRADLMGHSDVQLTREIYTEHERLPWAAAIRSLQARGTDRRS
ncbi:MAG: tyrosine-type recombinase/integrase [Planctomycetes bacterium]|nr:tyrosine-type recombinase/integrase [Planctomycetota bacterium]